MIVVCGGCQYGFEPGGYRDAQCPVCHEITPIMRSCPACEQPLVARKVSDMVAEECKQCHGIFLEDEAVRRITSAGQHARVEAVLTTFASRPAATSAPTESAPPRTCPTCSTPMKRTLSPEGAGIILDVCRPHGTFFDAGELHKIIDFVQRGRIVADRDRSVTQPALATTESPPSSQPSEERDPIQTAAFIFVGAVLILLKLLV